VESNSSVLVQRVTNLTLKSRGWRLSFVRRTTLAGQHHPEEHLSYAVCWITDVTDSRVGEEIHFIAQGLKKAFLERTYLKAQLTACLTVVAKVS
jgi:hypothetical protein